MNRIDRLNAILIHLQSKKIVTAKELAERFRISIRTVYRDIKALEEAGVPLGAEAGVGYFLPDNYNLPPVMFTNDEATALLFGSKFIEQMSNEKIKKSFESALFKIKSVLRTPEKDYLNKLHSHITVMKYADNEEENNPYLSDIQKVLVTKNVIEIEYHTHYSNEKSNRIVEPIGLLYYGFNWHLIAFCRKRDDYRDFRLDRIKKIIINVEKYNADKLISIEEYNKKMQSNEDKCRIVLKVSKESARFIKDSKHWYGLESEKEINDKYIEMEFKNSDLFGFSRWVILGGKYIEVIEPKELKEIVISFAKEITEHYIV